MQMHTLFQKKSLHQIALHEATRVKRRPRVLDAADAIDCLFRVVRTGMQWSEVRATTASYTSVFKHTRRWIQAGLIEASYSSVLQEYSRFNHPRHYSVDSSYMSRMPLVGRVWEETQSIEDARRSKCRSSPITTGSSTTCVQTQPTPRISTFSPRCSLQC